MHGMSSSATRRMGAEAADKPGSGLTMDPDADSLGIRRWLDGLGSTGTLAVAFDTRLTGVSAFTGRASRGISAQLKRHGYRVLGAPESFLVSNQNKLLDGETERAFSWGAQIGEDALSVAAMAL